MTKTICGKTYNTEDAEIVKKLTFGTLGDESGYEQTLYITDDGKYFFYTNGGAKSKYPNEDIKRASKAAAEKWLAEN